MTDDSWCVYVNGPGLIFGHSFEDARAALADIDAFLAAFLQGTVIGVLTPWCYANGARLPEPGLDDA